MGLFNRTQQRPVAKILYSDPNSAATLSTHLKTYFHEVSPDRELIFVCIGTDRSTGDALGPLVGSQLKKYHIPGLHLYGTLDRPVHAMNLEDTIREIHESFPNAFVVGIDACLGLTSSVGFIQLGEGPLKPGAGVKKELPVVGDIHITGVVNVGGFMEYFVLQNTRLHLVISMAEVIAKGIYLALFQTGRILSPALHLNMQAARSSDGFTPTMTLLPTE